MHGRYVVLGVLAACGPGLLTGGREEEAGNAGAEEEFQPVIDAAACGETVPVAFDEIPAPPDMLLVVDVSGSMREELADGSQKWQVMRDTLRQVVQARRDDIHFGLALFPLEEECGEGRVLVDVGPGTSSAIVEWLDGIRYPAGSTPTHTTLEQARAYFQAHPVNPHGRYVLLATDGVPNCGPWGVEDSTVEESIAAISRLAALGVRTYVIGFGAGVVVDPGALEAMAQTGQTARSYRADSPTQLAGALDLIATEVAVPSCHYVLDETPPDPSLLAVTFDGTPVPRTSSHTNGWDYDAAAGSITFFGTACAALQAGAVAAIHVDRGCSGPVVD